MIIEYILIYCIFKILTLFSDEVDVLKMIIKWALFMWPSISNVPWKHAPPHMEKNDTPPLYILSPFDDGQKTIDKLKQILEEIHQEASVFDLNTYFNDVFNCASENIFEQELLPFYRKMLRPIPEDVRKSVPEQLILEKIRPLIRILFRGDGTYSPE